MRNLLKSNSSAGASFLPADYLQRKHERRANFLCLSLFLIVIFGVVGAFFVTNREWETVREQQMAINVRYTQAAKEIEQLKELEGQKSEMDAKAELASALIEKAPRSVILAEIINRLPENSALLQLELSSKRVVSALKSRSQQPSNQPRSLAQQTANAAPPKPEAPRFTTTLTIVGVAHTHNEVAQFVSDLQDSKLLERIDLKYSEITLIDKEEYRKFLIHTKLRQDADARSINSTVDLRGGAFLGNEAAAHQDAGDKDVSLTTGGDDEQEEN